MEKEKVIQKVIESFAVRILEVHKYLLDGNIPKSMECIEPLIRDVAVESFNQGVASTKKSTQIDGVEYIDLGLPSGTLWSKVPVGKFTYQEALSMSIPTQEQFEELRNECQLEGHYKEEKEGAGNYLAIVSPNGVTLKWRAQDFFGDNHEESRSWVLAEDKDDSTYGVLYPNGRSYVEGNCVGGAFKGDKYYCWLVKTPAQKPVEFVDLGLPSGTKWAKEALQKKISMSEAGSQNIPTTEQFEELIAHCKVLKVLERRNGQAGTLKLAGPNGNVIHFNVENHFDNLEWEAWNHYQDDDDYYSDKDTTLPKENYLILRNGDSFSKGQIGNYNEANKIIEKAIELSEKLECRLVQ